MHVFRRAAFGAAGSKLTSGFICRPATLTSRGLRSDDDVTSDQSREEDSRRTSRFSVTHGSYVTQQIEMFEHLHCNRPVNDIVNRAVTDTSPYARTRALLIKTVNHAINNSTTAMESSLSIVSIY